MQNFKIHRILLPLFYNSHQIKSILPFKGPYADHILTPQGLTGSSMFFWYQMKAHIFLIANPKISASNSL